LIKNFFNISVLTYLLLIALVAASQGASKYPPLPDALVRLHRGIIPPTEPKAEAGRVTEGRYTVQRDHFNPLENNTFQIRYYEESAFFRSGGPIFIFVGGESVANAIWLQTGHMFDMARQYGAHMFHTEHRYYGYSHPVPDARIENLQWLTVDQAIEDLVEFVRHVKNRYPELKDAKVLLTGGSYAANMVAWARQKYPLVFAGAWASSGPVLAKVDFFEYKEKMNDAYLSVGGPQCHSKLEKAFQDMEMLIGQGNVSRLESAFNLCFPLDMKNQLDVWNFFSSLSNVLAGPVQYQTGGQIETVCYFVDQGQDAIDGLAAYVSYVYQGGCLATNYDNFVAYFAQEDLNIGGQYRQWLYQTCNEFGYFQSSGSPNQIFGNSFPINLNIAQCKDIFDTRFNNNTVHANIDKVNDRYGGLYPRATNVIYTNGDLDPWSALSLEEAAGEGVHVEWIPGSAHCGDIYSNAPTDTPQMRAVRDKITQLFGEWSRN